jgi:hypothetical protein
LQGAGNRADKVVAALKSLKPKLSNIMVPGAADVDVEIWAVLDPVSKTAQRVAPILDFLRKTLRPSIKVGCAQEACMSCWKESECFEQPHAL